MAGTPKDHGAATKALMRRDLGAALKARRKAEVQLLRALISALDNAEAQPALKAPASEQRRFDDRSAEVQRRLLSVGDVRSILAAEIRDRERAADELESLGKPERADTLRREAQLAARYLEG